MDKHFNSLVIILFFKISSFDQYIYLFLSYVPGTVLVSGCEVPAFLSAVSGEHWVNEGRRGFSVFITVFMDFMFPDILDA